MFDNKLLASKLKFIIFTDLDGTLLDHDTYSWEAARPALERCKELKIPVIICSSKSRSEIEYIRREMDIDSPFITENGGGIYMPATLFHFPNSTRCGPFWVLKLGVPHKTLCNALKKVKETTDVEIVGFSSMDHEELVSLTGLEGDSLKRALRRDFDEPFIIRKETPQKLAKVQEAIQRFGLVYTRGGRFHHITGDNDKGLALNKITGLYKSFNKSLQSIALGDSLNDLPMLNAADIPVLVQKSDGSYDSKIFTPGLLYADGIGPYGWNKAILKILAEIHDI